MEKDECASSKMQGQEEVMDVHFHYFYSTLYSAISQEKGFQFGSKKMKHSLYAHSTIFLCRKFDGIIKATTGQKLKQ